MSGVFLSYRRKDSGATTELIADDLRRRFGRRQVFIDVDDIEYGHVFSEVIEERLMDSTALVAVIGPDWLDATDHDGNRRLDDPDDLVRREIATALEAGIAVVPVLLDGARMPRRDQLPEDLEALAERNALRANEDDVGMSVAKLAKAIEPALAVKTWPARASGGLLYAWTGGWGLFAGLIVLFISTFTLCSDVEPETPVVPLFLVLLVFLAALGLVAAGRRMLRSRRGFKRQMINFLLWVIAPIAFVVGVILGNLSDPNN